MTTRWQRTKYSTLMLVQMNRSEQLDTVTFSQTLYINHLTLVVLTESFVENAGDITDQPGLA